LEPLQPVRVAALGERHDVVDFGGERVAADPANRIACSARTVGAASRSRPAPALPGTARPRAPAPGWCRACGRGTGFEVVRREFHVGSSVPNSSGFPRLLIPSGRGGAMTSAAPLPVCRVQALLCLSSDTGRPHTERPAVRGGATCPVGPGERSAAEVLADRAARTVTEQPRVQPVDRVQDHGVRHQIGRASRIADRLRQRDGVVVPCRPGIGFDPGAAEDPDELVPARAGRSAAVMAVGKLVSTRKYPTRGVTGSVPVLSPAAATDPPPKRRNPRVSRGFVR